MLTFLYCNLSKFRNYIQNITVRMFILILFFIKFPDFCVPDTSKPNKVRNLKQTPKVAYIIDMYPVKIVDQLIDHSGRDICWHHESIAYNSCWTPTDTNRLWILSNKTKKLQIIFTIFRLIRNQTWNYNLTLRFDSTTEFQKRFFWCVHQLRLHQHVYRKPNRYIYIHISYCHI